MFIVQVNDNEGVLKELVHVGCDRQVAETKFFGACETNLSNWDGYSTEARSILLDEGYCKYGGGCVMLIDTDGVTSDDELRDDLTGQPHGDMTVAEIVQSGEIGLTEGMTVDDIITLCGVNLDAACSWDIQGQILFKGSDNRWYTITTESIIGIANPQWVEDTLADAEPPVECKFCHKMVDATNAHAYQGGWVGDKCCWAVDLEFVQDERC